VSVARGERPDGPAQQPPQGAKAPERPMRQKFEKRLHSVYSESIADLIDNLRGDCLSNTAKACAIRSQKRIAQANFRSCHYWRLA